MLCLMEPAVVGRRSRCTLDIQMGWPRKKGNGRPGPLVRAPAHLQAVEQAKSNTIAGSTTLNERHRTPQHILKLQGAHHHLGQTGVLAGTLKAHWHMPGWQEAQRLITEDNAQINTC